MITSEKRSSRSEPSQTEKIEKIKVGGMTCSHCETAIEKALEKTEGVLEVKASYNKNEVIVAFDGDTISLEKIKAVITDTSYTPKDSTTPEKKKIPAWVSTIGIVVMLVAGFFIFNQLGLFDFVNIFPTASENTALGMLFVIGLLTSVHCIAMCGSIGVSQCVKKEDAQNCNNDCKNCATPYIKNKITAKTFRSSFLYNLGRVISYTVIGMLVGAIGSVLSFNDTGRGVVMIVAAAFMIIMGLNLLGLFPFLRWLTPRMPKFFAKKIDKQKEKSNSPLIIGLLNGLMPCGPLQTMQIYALSTGSWFLGGLSMFLFALGTVPLMFFVGALSTLLTKKFAKKITMASGILVIVMGMFMLNNGISIFIG